MNIYIQYIKKRIYLCRRLCSVYGVRNSVGVHHDASEVGSVAHMKLHIYYICTWHVSGLESIVKERLFVKLIFRRH